VSDPQVPNGSPTRHDPPATPQQLTERLLWPAIPGGLYPETVETIRVLAEILGAPRQEPTMIGASEWVAALLQVTEPELSKVEVACSNTQLLLHGHVLAGWMDTWNEQIKILGPRGEAPEWRPLDLGQDHTSSVPYHLSVYFPGGTLRSDPVGVHICGGQPADVTVYTGIGQRQIAESVLDEFRATLNGPGNPFRGRILHASGTNAHDLRLAPVAASGELRSDLVMPDELWGEVDLFLAAATSRREDLLSLGLSTSRGLLIAGPPGVGKTKLGRILATELQGRLTVILADLTVLKSSAEQLYNEIEKLGPTMIVLEDIDSIGDRGNRKSSAFSEFLNALDGARLRDGILTLATTNDPGSLDPAVTRPGRFDAIVTVPLPDLAAREQILRLYLPGVDRTHPGADVTGVDAASLAAEVDGLSGADLRELVRRAVLEFGVEGVTTAAVREIIRRRSWKSELPTGHYL